MARTRGQVAGAACTVGRIGTLALTAGEVAAFVLIDEREGARPCRFVASPRHSTVGTVDRP